MEFCGFFSNRPRCFELELEPWIVTRAQFMYISLLPILLNKVQAKRVKSDDGAKLGTVKS